MRIDAHQHFWHFNPTEYDWIDNAMQSIRRDFLPSDLRPELDSAGIDGAISVQARQCVVETEWLLQLAEEHEFIQGVVGWAPLVDHDVSSTLERLVENPQLCGIRHVLQGEPNDDYVLRDDFNRGIALLEHFGLAYDILVLERHLPQTIEFVDRHPNQVFVLDHIAKPQIASSLVDPWRKYIVELAKRENVFCKVSGMVTEANFKCWTPKQLQPYWDTVLDAFGPGRLLYASDWPVCLVACDYLYWHQTVTNFATQLSSKEKQALFGDTALRAYSLTADKE